MRDDIAVVHAVKGNTMVIITEHIWVIFCKPPRTDTADLFAYVEDVQALYTSLNQFAHGIDA